MNDNGQKQSSILEQGASAASTVKAAVKVGKAVSGMAKGAAAGPFGMAAGALLSNHKVRKGLLIVICLLLIPILFIVMLPLMVFGMAANALTAPYDGGNPPVMNDDMAIVENIVTTNNELAIIIEEAYADLMAKIDKDFSSSGADVKEVDNPYAGSNVMNPLIIISQFCASKDQSYEEISLENLVDIVRENRDKLFKFNRELKWEMRKVLVKKYNEGTRQMEEVEEDQMQLIAYYTFVYNGESYFADEIFHLSDEQKTLAQNYYDNLILYLGDKYNLLIGNADFGDLILQYPFIPVPGGFANPLPVDWRANVTDEFGTRGGTHRGIDIGAPVGTPIFACRPGVVIVSSPWVNSWGEYVVINHGDGMTTLYAHMGRRNANVGDVVEQGAVIGYVGMTGVTSGPHLHLEVSVDGVLRNPRDYLP